jgi:D-threo-aldose 1-dehydrogenase
MTDSIIPPVLARRPFGQTPLQVPPIAIGCAPLGNMVDTFQYAVSEEDAVATVKAALASPLDYIDTAAHYGDGESERRVGIALRELGGLPNGAILQTKAGRDATVNDFSGEMVRVRFERSLELLGLDQIAIVYLHDAEHTTFEAAMSPGGPVEVLKAFQQQGVIKHLGVASGPIDVETQYVETGLFDAVITHNRYTLLNRTADPLIDLAHDRGMAVLNAAPYGSGMLAKGTAAYPRYAYQPASAELVATTRQYETICERYGVPLAAVSLQFSTQDPRITATIVGMSHPKRIQQTIDLLTTDIPTACWEEINAVPVPDPEDPEKHRWT